MTDLHLSLFGEFACSTADGTEVDVPRRKSRALLVYLALQAGRPVPRERLALLLWGDASGAQARANLRKTLSRLRQALPEQVQACLDAGPKQLRLAPETVEVDAVRFELCAGKGTPDALAEAAALWRGPLLDMQAGCGEAFDEWLDAQRRRLEELALGVLSRHLDLQTITGDIDNAIDTAQRLLVVDPLQEDVHRKLMRLYVLQDRAGAAVRQYETCRDLLSTELAIEPARETRQLRDVVMRRSEPAGPAGTGTCRTDLPDPPSLHIAPLRAMRNLDDLNDLAAGLASDLAIALGRNRQLDIAVSADAPNRTSYRLEGEIRTAGRTVRVVPRLVECGTGLQLWAESFDLDRSAALAAQDAIVRDVAAHVVAALSHNEQERARRKALDILDARELWQLGMRHLYRFRPEDSSKAQRMFERAVLKAPEFAPAYAGLALNGYATVTFGNLGDAGGVLAQAAGFGEQAVYLDEGDAFAHFALGRVRTLLGRLDLAIPSLERAVTLNPGFGYAHYGLGFAHYWTGECGRAAEHVGRAVAASPCDPMLWSFKMLDASAHYQCGRYERAEACARDAIRSRGGEFWNHLVLAVALKGQNRGDEACRAAADARRLKPGLSLSLVANSLPQLDERCLERYLNDMADVGVPA